MQLFKEYTLRCGEIIIFDGVSFVNDHNSMPVDIFTSSKHHGAWNQKGLFLSNVLFLNGKESEMDVVNDKRQ